MSDVRIELNEDGTLDEFVAANASIHFEQMGDGQWWIGVDMPDGRGWHINLGAENPRAKTYAFIESNDH